MSNPVINQIEVDDVVYDIQAETTMSNGANLLVNAGFTNLDEWNASGVTVQTTGFPANNIVVASGGYIRQYIGADRLLNGTYYLSMTWEGGDKYTAITAYGLKADYSTTLLLKVEKTSTTKTFYWDSSAYTQLEVRITNGDITEKLFSKPLLTAGAEPQSFYAEAYAGMFEELKKVPKIQEDVDALKIDSGVYNQYNLLKNVNFDSAQGSWTGVVNYSTVRDTQTPAKSITIADQTYIQQSFNLTDLAAGKYTVYFKADSDVLRCQVSVLKGAADDYASENICIAKPFEVFPEIDIDPKALIAAGYISLTVSFSNYTGKNIAAQLTEPFFGPITGGKTFWHKNFAYLYLAADKLPNLEEAIQILDNELAGKDFMNGNNLLVDAGLTDSSKWANFNATIVNTGLPANKVSITNSGSAQHLRQYLPINKFKSGEYYASIRWASNNKGSLTIAGIDSSYKSTTLLRIDANTLDTDKIFYLDTSLYDQVSYMFSLGNVTTVEVTEPVLAAVKDAEIPTFYNKPYQKVFSAVIEVDALKSQVGNINPLYGKVISFNGDSICEGIVNGGGYGKIIGERNNMAWQNVGVSGGTIMPVDGKYYITGGVQNMRADADYVILEGGFNDTYGIGRGEKELGEIGTDYKTNYDTSTYCNAFQKMLYDAYQRFPGKKIGYIAVHQCAYWRTNATNNYPNDVYLATIRMCEKWGVPVCNLAEDTAPLAMIQTFRDNYTTNSDGTHPTEEGYLKFYCDKIEAWLKTL